jgi:hypothetical protein
MDRTFGDATFNLYPAVNFDQPRSATPSSGYSFNPYTNYQSSNHSGPSSEFEYLSASGLSTPSSGLDFFDNNASEPNLDWGPSLAAFFDSVETPALESSSNPSFLPPDNLSFATLVSDPTGINNGISSGISDAPFRCSILIPPRRTFPPSPQESFKFDDDNPRLMTQEEMDGAGEAWQWVPSDTVWLDKDVSSDVYIPPQPFPVTKNFKVVRIERIHGIPSQFPVPRVPTAYIVDFASVRDTYKDEDGEMRNLNKILKDKVRIFFLRCRQHMTITRTSTLGTGLPASGRKTEPP